MEHSEREKQTEKGKVTCKKENYLIKNEQQFSSSAKNFIAMGTNTFHLHALKLKHKPNVTNWFKSTYAIFSLELKQNRPIGRPRSDTLFPAKVKGYRIMSQPDNCLSLFNSQGFVRMQAWNNFFLYKVDLPIEEIKQASNPGLLSVKLIYKLKCWLAHF